MGAAEVSEASPLARLQSMGVSDTRGKHRVQAELKRLEQEARSLEMEGLDTPIINGHVKYLDFPWLVTVSGT
ncbi:hypothetical protein CRG98_046977 [Punica granatum]|uniref:Uncharacterized protein n=1 Tax=Punica granatum TaxID=22663 RepID=A0A2I0HMC6_PUNGR|nr:hypothetical protein CRG98_046977 [Punica granatum]